jgi:hypothetical protein
MGSSLASVLTVEHLIVAADLSNASLRQALKQAEDSGMKVMFLLTSPENYFIGRELCHPDINVCKSRMLVRFGWMLVCDKGVVLSESY